MPDNRNFLGKDGNWYSDIWERNAADTRYEQNEKQISELQKANELEKERQIQNERQHQELLKERKRKEKFEQELQLALVKGRLKTLQEEDKENQCKELGISYRDLKDFINILERQTPELKKLLEKREKLEVNFRKLKENEPKEELSFEKQKQKICSLENEIKMYNTGGFFQKLSNKQKIKECEDIIQKIQNQIELGKKEYEQQKTKLKEEYKQRVEESKQLLDNINKQVEKEKNKPTLKTDFNKFRETHYNTDIELLFKRLEVNLDKVENKQEGKIEDYIKYFKTKILEN